MMLYGPCLAPSLAHAQRKQLGLPPNCKITVTAIEQGPNRFYDNAAAAHPTDVEVSDGLAGGGGYVL